MGPIADAKAGRHVVAPPLSRFEALVALLKRRDAIEKLYQELNAEPPCPDVRDEAEETGDEESGAEDGAAGEQEERREDEEDSESGLRTPVGGVPTPEPFDEPEGDCEMVIGDHFMDKHEDCGDWDSHVWKCQRCGMTGTYYDLRNTVCNAA